MNSENKQLASWIEQHFYQFEASLNGQSKSNLHQKRRLALEQFKEVGFPHTGLEEWKYTNPAVIAEAAFPPSFLTESNTSIDLASFDKFKLEGLDTIKILLSNGKILHKPADLEGVEILTLKEALLTKNEIIEKHLSQHASNQEAFVAMNSALMSEVLVIILKANVVLNKRLEIISLNTSAVNERSVFNRALFIAEKNAQAEIIERMVSENSDSRYFQNSVLEFAIEENANISHYRIQNESCSSYLVTTIAATLKERAVFSTFTFSFGGSLVRNHVNVIMEGPNCHVTMNGLTAISGNQQVDNQTLLDNAKPNCESIELYKGIYADASEGVFSGTIIVRPDAQKTNAIQSNRSLLLSDKAKINAKPQLKIWADDVKCTHGATIGQLDQDAMFYLKSRGISDKDARIMLIHAFASEIISAVKIESLRPHLEQLLLEKLKLTT